MAHKNSGYTLQQTILVVAAIAILATILVASVVPLVINQNQANKLAGQLRTMEESNKIFKMTHSVWPEEALNRTGDLAGGGLDARVNVARILVESGFITAGTRFGDKLISLHENLLSFTSEERTTDSSGLVHEWNPEGEIAQRQLDLTVHGPYGTLNSGNYYVIRFTKIPFSIAEELDEIIDITPDPQAGRLIISNISDNADDMDTICGDPAPVSGDIVSICYIANPTDTGF